jgi:ParB/RepB/Spo0J family partition protein
MADSTTVAYEKGKLYDLNLADVQPDPDQPRKYFDEQALSELKSSIEKHGVLQPVLVRQGAEGGLLLVSGERRYQAAKLARISSIPAVFIDGEPTEISIVENLLRENLTAIRNKWPTIKKAVERGVDLANSFGIDRDNLTSNNALIPVIYYLYKNPGATMRGSTSFEVRNAQIFHVSDKALYNP